MDLVTGAVGSIIDKLGTISFDKLQAAYKLHTGLPEEIESLKKDLEHAHTALLKVGEVPRVELDPQVRQWAREVRDASYDMEDILDTFLAADVTGPADDPKKNEGMCKRLLEKITNLFHKTKATHAIARAVEDMKKRLEDVAHRRDTFAVAVAPPAPATRVDPRLVDMHKEAAQLIGIDNTKQDLIAMLLPPSRNSRSSTAPSGCCSIESKRVNRGGGGGGRGKKRRMVVSGQGQEEETRALNDVVVSDSSSEKMKMVSVVGVGGLGKTTLAKAVYDQLKPQYDFGAFVSVGRNPDLVQVLTSIFFHLDTREYEAIRDLKVLQLLIGELRKFLQNKRYFIVIDDVWETESWKVIKSAFDETNSESKVITTTRNREVVREEEVYELDPLSCENSKKLFYMRLFGGEDKCPANHPHEQSEKILKKCGGVPLAIITMASLLVGKSREYWVEVCNSPGFYRGKGTKQAEDTEWILSLSYYDLPSHLKVCLLYLSVYPEDYWIYKNSLLWKWIAEGFIQKKEGTSLFQQAEECFLDLINRSMIQADESAYDGNIHACRVHDMVLDLIRGLSDEENFVTISNNDEGTSSRSKVRRLAYQNKTMVQIDEDMPQARSLVACGCRINGWVLHQSFRLLRVLALEGCTSCSFDSIRFIGHLVHLRYLGMRYTEMFELPEEIGALKHLQILDMEGTLLQRLPSSACLLTQLVCLRGCMVDGTILPDGFLRTVTSLEELVMHFDDEPNRQDIKDLGNLSQLRVLKISFGSAFDASMQSVVQQSLGKLQKLQHLALHAVHSMDETARREWDTVVLPQPLQQLEIDRIFQCLPPCIDRAHLPNLSHLTLHLEHIDEAGLRVLGELPELRFLSLIHYCRLIESSNATVANINSIDGFFPKLRWCEFDGWIVQFVTDEDSTGVSFSIWDGKGAMAFASKTEDNQRSRVVAPALVVMPNLRLLEFIVPVRALYGDGRNGSCENLGLECLPSLHKITAVVDREGATADDVKKAEAELRHAAQVHPNRPILEIKG